MSLPKQQKLLQIIKTWRISEKPEYRGFRCANCQNYQNKAWYHWVNREGYKLPVHLCDKICEKQFIAGTIEVDHFKMTEIDKKTFGNQYKFSDKTKKRFKEIINSWPESEKPSLKNFTCDECGLDLEIDPLNGLRKGYHVWWKMDDEKTLTEFHFHKSCGNKLGVM